MVKTRHRVDVAREVPFRRRTRPGGLLECMPLEDLFKRASRDHWKRPEVLQFHLWAFFARGRCRHAVDFDVVECVAGTVLHVRPGQVHRWDPQHGLDGYALLAGLGALSGLRAGPTGRFPPLDLDAWPTVLQIAPARWQNIEQRLDHLWELSRSPSGEVEDEAILWHLTMATLIDVRRTARTNAAEHPAAPPSHEQLRYQRFRRLLERSFRETRAVVEYASALGCSVRSLDRTTREIEGRTAKQLITARVLLEAKRLLAHGDLSLDALAERLGFSEATQLAKFFRRGVGETAGAFRGRYRGVISR